MLHPYSRSLFAQILHKDRVAYESVPAAKYSLQQRLQIYTKSASFEAASSYAASLTKLDQGHDLEIVAVAGSRTAATWDLQ